MYFPAASWAGGYRVRSKPNSYSTRSSRPCMLFSLPDKDGLVHHSDRGSQYLSIRYSERLAECGIQASVGTTGDSYDNALAESIIGLYKTEVIRRRGPWRNVEAVEFATLEWVDWFQQPTASRADRLHPAGRSRGTLLRHAQRHSHGRVTQTKWPPAKPERFKSPRKSRLCLVASPKIALRQCGRHQLRHRRIQANPPRLNSVLAKCA